MNRNCRNAIAAHSTKKAASLPRERCPTLIWFASDSKPISTENASRTPGMSHANQSPVNCGAGSKPENKVENDQEECANAANETANKKGCCNKCLSRLFMINFD